MIKAIETKYKGYRFRSRLEARWAVFFDTAGLKWDYEHEGVNLGEQGYYLPDFCMLHNRGRGPIIEIKPYEPSAVACDKLVGACEMAGAYGALIWGTPGQEQWRSVHKDGFWDGDENHSDLVEFLGAYGIPKSEAQRRRAVGVVAARSARFEHGDYHG